MSDILPKDGKRFVFKYTYDMGDNWEHEVLCEGVVKQDSQIKYPVCIEGERACPPENCGGPPGYDQIVAALQDPESDDFHEVQDFVGWGFDPEKFNICQATKKMLRGLNGRK